MADQKLRIGVIGLGTFVEIAHMPTYFHSRYAPHIEVAALCDLDAGRVSDWQKKYSIAGGYTDLDKMLAKEQLDAAVVVTPDHAHTAVTLKCLDAGCDVLVEKPLAMSVQDCHAIIERANKVKRRVVTDFHKREDPAHQEARTRMAENRYGPVQFGYAWMQDVISIPAGGFFKTSFAENSSPVWFLGVHFYDLIRFITQLDPVRVCATAYKQEIVSRGVNTLDAVKSDFWFNNGAAISVFASWNLPDNIPSLTRQGLYLQCQRGEFTINSCDRGYSESTMDVGYRSINPMFTRRTSQGYAGYGHDSIGEALEEFLQIKLSNRDAYEQYQQADPSGVSGLYSSLMAQATDTSLERGESLDGGKVIRGVPVEINDLLKETLGQAASAYLIKDIT